MMLSILQESEESDAVLMSNHTASNGSQGAPTRPVHYVSLSAYVVLKLWSREKSVWILVAAHYPCRNASS